ncbi:TATA box-binding protein-associated factor RNA polymerase I subunit A, partial [Elysia marginata]
DLIKLDPCNPLCIELYKLSGDDQPSNVSLLFDFLDYDHCNNNETVLSLLALRLQEVPENVMLKKEVQRCWESRSSWWPATVLKDACLKRKHCDKVDQDWSGHTSNCAERPIAKAKRKIYKVLRNL